MELPTGITATVIPQQFIWRVKITPTTSLAVSGLVNVPPWIDDGWAAAVRSIVDTDFGGCDFERATLLRICDEGQNVRDVVLFNDDVPEPEITTNPPGDHMLGVDALPEKVVWPSEPDVGASGFITIKRNGPSVLMLWHLGPLWLTNEKACREFYRHLFPPPAQLSIKGARAVSEVEGNLPGAAWIAFADLIANSYIPFDIRAMSRSIRANLKDMLDGIDRVKDKELPLEGSNLVGDLGPFGESESGLVVPGKCMKCIHEAITNATDAQRAAMDILASGADVQRASKKGKGLNSVLSESENRTFRRSREKLEGDFQNCSHIA